MTVALRDSRRVSERMGRRRLGGNNRHGPSGWVSWWFASFRRLPARSGLGHRGSFDSTYEGIAIGGGRSRHSTSPSIDPIVASAVSSSIDASFHIAVVVRYRWWRWWSSWLSSGSSGCARDRAKCTWDRTRDEGMALPGIVAEQQPARGHEEADHDGRRRRARNIVGFLPAHGNGHGVGICDVNPGSAASPERLRVGQFWWR